MLGQQKVEPKLLAAPWQIVQRRVALAQRDRVRIIVQNGQEFTVPPHPGLVDRQGGIPPLRPQVPQRRRIGQVPGRSALPAHALAALAPGVLHFIQLARLRVAKVARDFLRRDARVIRNASQLV